MKITKAMMRKAKPENLRRLARWLKLRNIDEMSDRQLIRLLHWLFTRRDKLERNMSWRWG